MTERAGITEGADKHYIFDQEIIAYSSCAVIELAKAIQPLHDHYIQVNHNSIRTLTGSNYKKWREDVEIALGLLDYEMVLTDEALSVPAIDASAETKTKYAKWIKANKMAILIMRRSISEEVRGSIIETESAKLFMEAIAENFQGSKKAEIGSLMSQLTDMKYNGEGCIRTHILNMVEIGNKLKALKVHVDETMMEEQSIRKEKGKEQVYLVQDTKFKPKEWTKNKNTDKQQRKDESAKGTGPNLSHYGIRDLDMSRKKE
ncbi:PREDICTED: uncharacterized protein LOC107880250 [Prunus mume]|uniref:Uncharacterized protein LOC107880250 n=1 Tax=Prunus mume TaxID=102107 RepID=A0ABM1LHS0_PRUMU|nr:PREDICTED: uncharacterized protein LOC107880250 [Prunus mume]